jgi:hypothetical protein
MVFIDIHPVRPDRLAERREGGLHGPAEVFFEQQQLAGLGDAGQHNFPFLQFGLRPAAFGHILDNAV